MGSSFTWLDYFEHERRKMLDIISQFHLIGLVEDELPSFQSKQKGDRSPEMEEERRNCFVAITRSIETLTLSYAKRYRGWPKEPSRFLFEMGLLNDETADA